MPREPSTPVASVAHEGNPRTASLTVSGTLDGDIFLIPLPPPPDAVSPEEIRPLPVPVESFSISASHSVKYVLTDFVFGTDGQSTGTTFAPNNTQNAIVGAETYIEARGSVLEFSKSNKTPMYGMIKSPRIAMNVRMIDNSDPTPGLSQFERSKKTFDMDFLQLFNFLAEPSAIQAGDRWGELPTNTAVVVIAQDAAAICKAVAIGEPFSGVAVCVPPTATHENFTGIVGAYDWGTQTQYLLRYRNQSLNGLGEVLGSFATTDYLVDDAITCRARKFRATGLWTLSTFGITVSGLADSAIPYFGPDMRVALVNLPSQVNSGIDDDFITWKLVSGEIWCD